METPGFVPPGYAVRYKLGSGQTSNVYLATHPTMGNLALKLPRPEVQGQPVLRRMFENEVQITLSLRHPHIVAGYAGNPTGAGAFLALEYCAGGTLDQLLLSGGPGGLEHAVRLVRDVAAGLEQTHAQQVLHRDVKPANVFLTDSDTAKLGDFGTGCFVSEENRDRVGTAFYMAPEIFEGQPASYASDVYSLGILAFEVLTGQRPFVGETYEQLMHAHTSSLPRPLTYFRKDIPAELANVVSRAMSRERNRRQPSVKQFREQFEQASGVELHAPAPATGRASRIRSVDDGQDGKAVRKGPFGWFRRRG